MSLSGDRNISLFSGLFIFLLILSVNFHQGNESEGVRWVLLFAVLFGLLIWNILRHPFVFLSLLVCLTVVPVWCFIRTNEPSVERMLLIVYMVLTGTVSAILIGTLMSLRSVLPE